VSPASASASDCPACTKPYVDLAALALKTLIAAAVGMSAAFVLYRFVPFNDPIDVVGPALMRGYSEAAEQWAFYGFWITTMVVGIAISAVRVEWDSPLAVCVGSLALLLLPHIPWLAQHPLAMPVFLVTWTATYVCGGRSTLIIERRFGPLRWPWIAVLLWCVGYHDAALEILREPQLGYRVVAAAVILLAGLYFWKDAGSPRISLGTLAVAIMVLLAAMRNASEVDLTLGLSAAVAYGLGVVALRQTGSALSLPIWLLFVLLTLLTAHHSGQFRGIETLLRDGIGGMGLGSIVHCFARDWTASARLTEFIRKRLLANASIYWIAGGACLAIWRPHWATIIAMSLALFFVLRRSRRHSLRLGPAVGIGMLLVLAVAPELPLLQLDTYHDGYNLTCAWEFESGRELYTEILPIRGFQFFVTWLSRQVLPKTVDAYLLTFSVLQIVPVIGAFALSLVWTRGSVPWSVACALVVTMFSDLDSRQGVHLVLAAATLSALHRDRRWTWLLIAGCSVVAGCCGFDALCPFVAATMLTLFCVPDAARIADPPAFYTRVYRAAQAALLSTVPFSLLIAVWQGPRAAAEYWLVLRDFAAHFNAFAGVPIQWHLASTRLLVGFGLIVLAAWVTVGAAYWRTMSPARRRFWLFLMIQSGFLLHRGVGRSGEGHLKDFVMTNLVLVCLGLFECLRQLRRDTRTFAWVNAQKRCLDPYNKWTIPYPTTIPRFQTPSLVTDSLWIVLLLGIVLFREYPTQLAHGSPAISQVRRILQSRDTIPLGEVPYVQHIVPPDETLWTIENTTSNYANGRHGPTRHPLAHTICSPSEQRRAAADMRRRPPRLIEWPTDGIKSLTGPDHSLNAGNFATGCVIHSLDGIAAPLRYYLISQELLPRYRPAERRGYLEPAPTNWTGLVWLAPSLNEELNCQRLPLAWGEKRVAGLAVRASDRVDLPEFQTTAPGLSRNGSAGQRWELSVPLEPRRFNYLLLTFTTAGPANDEPSSTAALHFTPDQWDDQTSSMAFTCATDERSHTYLLPVGCCPGWVWRSRISRLRIVAPAGVRLSAPRAQAWFVDELRQ
jgi:hypothetical protein